MNSMNILTPNFFLNKGANTMFCLQQERQKSTTRYFLPFVYLTLSLLMPQVLANQLEKIGYAALPGNQVQINLSFSQTAQPPASFSTENPARIVLDFPGSTMNLNQKSQPVGIGVVQSTSAVETQDRTRVVLNLVRMVPFDINVKENQVLVSINNLSGGRLTTEQTDTLSPAALQPLSTDSPQSPHIQDINFRRTRDNTGRIVVTLSEPSIVADVRQQGQQIIVDFLDAYLPDRLNRRLDVIDFSTPISFIDTFPEGDNVRMNITVDEAFEFHAQQSEYLYIIEINEKIEEKTKELSIEERSYEGQLVSFNFQDIEVRAALALLFDLPGVNLNMVASDEVGGNLTLRLKNVPWDQALDIILEARGLGKRQIGNVVMIDLKENIDARKQRELEAQKAIKQLEPLYTEFIQVNYAKAGELVPLLKTSGEHSFLSTRGSVSMDERTNKLIVQDTAEKLAEVRKLITSLDKPVRQVLIESRVVLANDNFARELGIKFGYSVNEDLGSGNGIVLGGKMSGNTEFSGGTSFNSDNTESYGATGGQPTGENFIVSLPIGSPSAALGLAIGKIGSYLLQLELAASETKGNSRIISSPRVITGNQKTATVLQGSEIPYRSFSQEGAKVEFRQAVLKLEVTPQITPDDRIIMELQVQSDKVGEITNDGQLTIDKRELQTQVLVDNGETIVLGGVYERENRFSVSRVPFLSDIPIIGDLFQSKTQNDINRELLIFVTPKIIKETA